MSRFLWKLLNVLILLTVVRASVHIIRLIILATLGLGGLVLYQAVTSGSPISHIQSAIGKRSVSEWTRSVRPSIALALELDDRACTRQYLCEVAAAEHSAEALFPRHLSTKTEDSKNALKIFKDAAELGLRLSNATLCHQLFPNCPYKNKDEMLSVLEKFKNI